MVVLSKPLQEKKEPPKVQEDLLGIYDEDEEDDTSEFSTVSYKQKQDKSC